MIFHKEALGGGTESPLLCLNFLTLSLARKIAPLGNPWEGSGRIGFTLV